MLFNSFLTEWERDYDLTPQDDDISVRFRNIIKSAYEVTGKKVVILVDEYDNPLVDSLDNRELFDDYRNQLSAIYSNFKSSADYIRLVFLTGVSRFGKVSVFSGLNNINDISFDNEFAEICGFTEDEIDEYFHTGISNLAIASDTSYDEVRNELKKYYDGYHFSSCMIDICNPYSFLWALARKEIKNYWAASIGAEFVSKLVAKDNLNIQALSNLRCIRETLIDIEPDSSTYIGMLYQIGYLTIKGYNRKSKIYTVGLPNSEVKEDLFGNLLPLPPTDGR